MTPKVSILCIIGSIVVLVLLGCFFAKKLHKNSCDVVAEDHQSEPKKGRARDPKTGRFISSKN